MSTALVAQSPPLRPITGSIDSIPDLDLEPSAIPVAQEAIAKAEEAQKVAHDAVVVVTVRTPSTMELVQQFETLFPEIPSARVQALLKKYCRFTQLPDYSHSEMESYTLEELHLIRKCLSALRRADHPELHDFLRTIHSEISRTYQLRKVRFLQNRHHLATLSELLGRIPRRTSGRMDLRKMMQTWTEQERIALLDLATRIYFDWHEPFASQLDFDQFLEFYKDDPVQSLHPDLVAILAKDKADIIKIAQPQRLYSFIFDSLSTAGKKLVIDGRIAHLAERSQECPKGPEVVVLGSGPAGMIRAMLASSKNCPVSVYDKRDPLRSNIVKINNNDYLSYFPIMQIMKLDGKARCTSSYIFPKIGCMEQAMEACLVKMGVVPDRSKEWISVAEDGENVTCVLQDIATKQNVVKTIPIVLDTMGASTPLAAQLGNRRTDLSPKDIMIVARYPGVIDEPSGDHPFLREHMMFEDMENSTTLSRAKSEHMKDIRKTFDTIRDLRGQVKTREILMERMVFPPSYLEEEIESLRAEIKVKNQEMEMQVAEILPGEDHIASSECFEAGYTCREKSICPLGGLILWAGDSFATGHPLDGQGMNVAIRAGAFAQLLDGHVRRTPKAILMRDYQFASIAQVDPLLGDR